MIFIFLFLLSCLGMVATLALKNWIAFFAFLFNAILFYTLSSMQKQLKTHSYKIKNLEEKINKLNEKKDEE